MQGVQKSEEAPRAMKRTCEVVERVGQAIFDKVCPGIRMKDADREVYKEAARAAIAAMSPADAVQIGDKVERIAGHRWPGEVVMAGYTLAGAYRVVVESTAPEVAGALHICSPDQLRKVTKWFPINSKTR
jgi:hypothetical protein